MFGKHVLDTDGKHFQGICQPFFVIFCSATTIWSASSISWTSDNQGTDTDAKLCGEYLMHLSEHTLKTNTIN